MKLERSRSRSLYINQAEYIQKTLERFRKEKSKPVNTLNERQTLHERRQEKPTANLPEYKEAIKDL